MVTSGYSTYSEKVNLKTRPIQLLYRYVHQGKAARQTVRTIRRQPYKDTLYLKVLFRFDSHACKQDIYLDFYIDFTLPHAVRARFSIEVGNLRSGFWR